jgi:hypothetical protein
MQIISKNIISPTKADFEGQQPVAAKKNCLCRDQDASITDNKLDSFRTPGWDFSFPRFESVTADKLKLFPLSVDANNNQDCPALGVAPSHGHSSLSDRYVECPSLFIGIF